MGSWYLGKCRDLIAVSGGFLGGFGLSSLRGDDANWPLMGARRKDKDKEEEEEQGSAGQAQWDHNWDKLEPVKRLSAVDGAESAGQDERKVKVANHLILVRHGQYNTRGKTDAEKKLTELGRLQAEVTGMRLAELNLPYAAIVKSTMTRAQETSALIESHLPEGLPALSDPLLVEGFPVAPDPPLRHAHRPESVTHQDGPRIEAAFRKYVHRAGPHEDHDRYSIIVCHANVIRYFVCRALQFPAEAWLRLSLNHASITWISVTPSGRVILRCYGETGHMLPQWISSR